MAAYLYPLMKVTMLTQQKVLHNLAVNWQVRASRLKLKPRTLGYQRAQLDFFTGAAHALETTNSVITVDAVVLRILAKGRDSKCFILPDNATLSALAGVL